MANYTPDLDSYDIQTEFGRSTHVLIKDCGTTSIIQKVYFVSHRCYLIVTSKPNFCQLHKCI